MTATASPTTRTGSPVRLTRRGRLVLVGLLVGLLLTAFSLGRFGDSAATAAPQASTSSDTGAAYATTTVHAGESLWAVAKRLAPDQDPRALVQALRTLNHLESASVQAGQQLLIPHGA